MYRTSYAGRSPLQRLLANGETPLVFPTSKKLNVEPLSEARTPLAGFFSILLGAELNALRQWQIVAPIGRVRLPPHIGFPGI